MKRPFSWIIVLASLAMIFILATVVLAASEQSMALSGRKLNRELRRVLAEHGFTGRIESTLEDRLGRKLDPQLVEIRRLLWFDTITGLNNDNTCAGCHSPTAGFGDTQSIAIGIENNGIVGPDRTGPRNMRRSPMIINTAFYPTLMWNSRFRAVSGDPFDNSAGLKFPDPEGLTLSYLPHLLTAQAFIPPTERTEVTGYDFVGDNDDIRAEVMNRLNNVPEYRRLFGQVYPEVKAGGPITPDMFGAAIAEFEFSLTFTDAPIDRFARGRENAMTRREKEGALLFFGKANCVQCHSVEGASNEMFSDFEQHVIGVPQIAPINTNNAFDGARANQDFGLEQISGLLADRYMFRTSPLRNIALQPTFMHNGAYTNLEDAIRHHLDAADYARAYTPASQGLDADLIGPTGPIEPVLKRLDPLLTTPTELTDREFRQLVAFVRHGLLDPQAKPRYLQDLVPRVLPSGRTPLVFEFP